MVVIFKDRRWEIDAVEFWEWDQRLTLREIDGAGRVRTREVWAAEVTFTDEVVPLALEPDDQAPFSTGGNEL